MDKLDDSPRPHHPPGLPHRPKLVLICGLFSLVYGMVLLFAGPDVRWYGVGVIVCAVVLIGMWFRDVEPKASLTLDTMELQPVKYNNVGPWYPFALMAIVVLQVCWAMYIQKR